MNRIAFLVAGVASGDRARARMTRHGCTPKGDALWSEQELDTLRKYHPDYQAAMRALGGKRTYPSVRAKAQQLGLTPKREHWTGQQVLRLRKIFRSGTSQQVRDAFPASYPSSNGQRMRSVPNFARTPAVRAGLPIRKEGRQCYVFEDNM